MSDSKPWTPWTEEDVMNSEEAAKRFDRVDDNFGKVFDLLRDQATTFNAHKTEEIEARTDHAGRIVTLEKANEARKGWSSNIIIAAIAAAFGAIAGYFSDFFKGKP